MNDLGIRWASVWRPKRSDGQMWRAQWHPSESPSRGRTDAGRWGIRHPIRNPKASDAWIVTP
jgi:hypothetical protein